MMLACLNLTGRRIKLVKKKYDGVCLCVSAGLGVCFCQCTRSFNALMRKGTQVATNQLVSSQCPRNKKKQCTHDFQKNNQYLGAQAIQTMSKNVFYSVNYAYLLKIGQFYFDMPMELESTNPISIQALLNREQPGLIGRFKNWIR